MSMLKNGWVDLDTGLHSVNMILNMIDGQRKSLYMISMQSQLQLFISLYQHQKVLTSPVPWFCLRQEI